MNGYMNFPRISFKGVFVFVVILGLGMLAATKPLILIGLSETMSLFIATSVSSTIGMSLVLLKVDDQVKDPNLKLKRILLSAVVSIVFSYLLVFHFR